MAIIERVSTLERLVADAAAQQAKTEKAIERFVEGMTAFRDGLDRDTQLFKESVAQTLALMRRDTEAFKESASRSNEAFELSMRQSNEAFKEHMRQTTEAFAAAEHQSNEEFRRSMEADREKSRRARNKTWGDLANKMGTVVEDVVAPNVRTVADTYFGQGELRHWGVRAHVPRLGDLDDMHEFDVIAFSRTHFFVNETKTTPRTSDAEAFVAFLPHLPEYFPGIERMELVPILSAFSIEDHIVKYLTRHGVYCMVMGGDTTGLANFDEVRARRTAR